MLTTVLAKTPRPIAGGPIVVLVASSHIVASGENTTPRLAPPSGKTISNFGGGRIQDDENPTDSVNLTSNQYREDEWCIKVRNNTPIGTVITFRVTRPGGVLIDTYTVMPQLTVG